MSGYAVSARIVRASPRLVAGGGREAVPAGRVTLAEWHATAAAPPHAVPRRLGERWGRFRDRLGQLTFYLFDPNSWR